jgi:hypothetical protein
MNDFDANETWAVPRNSRNYLVQFSSVEVPRSGGLVFLHGHLHNPIGDLTRYKTKSCWPFQVKMHILIFASEQNRLGNW